MKKKVVLYILFLTVIAKNVFASSVELNLIEVAIRKFTDFDSVLPTPVKALSIATALLCFGIHFYKNQSF